MKVYVHLAVRNARENYENGANQPVWVVRPANTTRNIVIARTVEWECPARTIFFDREHALPDAGQNRQATAVIELSDDKQARVLLDDHEPMSPAEAIRRFGWRI